MRLATYLDPDSRPRAALVVDDGGQDAIIDLHDATDGALPADMVQLLAGGRDALARAAAAQAHAVRIPLSEVTLLAPIPRPPKLLAAAGNYQAHVLEGGLPAVNKSGTVPKLFLKPSTTVIPAGAALELTRVSSSVDWELELAIVIGTAGRDIPEEHALEHVAGYTIINDISARKMDWGIEQRNEGASEGFFDWLEGKWIDGFAPLGPWIVTADEIPDPDDLDLRLTVNGGVVQEANTDGMIFSVRELIAFSSRLMTLEPGDVIATGTPAGVGDTTGVYLKAGDLMEGWIEKLGVLTTPVVAAR